MPGSGSISLASKGGDMLCRKLPIDRITAIPSRNSRQVFGSEYRVRTASSSSIVISITSLSNSAPLERS